MENSAFDRLVRLLGANDARFANSSVRPLTPDASTREYFRINGGLGSAIACVYPTDEAGLAQFDACLDVTGLFLSAGLPVARVLESDREARVIVHEDFGDTILRDALAECGAGLREAYIDSAISLIARIQAATGLAYERASIASRLSFDFEKLSWELGFFVEHYFGSLRGRDPSLLPEGFRPELDAVAGELAGCARVLTHRDYHAANLMLKDGDLKIIDHQDARIGALSYDLVSLLLDRVTELPSPEWLASKRELLLRRRSELGLEAVDADDFAAEFRLQTVQRCLKAIGTFSYQSANRGKTHFEGYIEPMFGIVHRALRNLGTFPVLEEVVGGELRL